MTSIMGANANKSSFMWIDRDVLGVDRIIIP
jgi:hypothetical protein